MKFQTRATLHNRSWVHEFFWSYNSSHLMLWQYTLNCYVKEPSGPSKIQTHQNEISLHSRWIAIRSDVSKRPCLIRHCFWIAWDELIGALSLFSLVQRPSGYFCTVVRWIYQQQEHDLCSVIYRSNIIDLHDVSFSKSLKIQSEFTGPNINGLGTDVSECGLYSI